MSKNDGYIWQFWREIDRLLPVRTYWCCTKGLGSNEEKSQIQILLHFLQAKVQVFCGVRTISSSFAIYFVVLLSIMLACVVWCVFYKSTQHNSIQFNSIQYNIIRFFIFLSLTLPYQTYCNSLVTLPLIVFSHDPWVGLSEYSCKASNIIYILIQVVVELMMMFLYLIVQCKGMDVGKVRIRNGYQSEVVLSFMV